jgi:hypothetical protein
MLTPVDISGEKQNDNDMNQAYNDTSEEETY